MKRVNIAIIIAWLVPICSFAQTKISATVIDSITSEPLVGAHVILDENYYTTTDKNGWFEFKKIKYGIHSLRVSFIGYEDFFTKTTITETIKLPIAIQLSPKAFMGEEVIIKSVRAYEKSPTTYEDINKAKIKEVNLGQDIPYILNSTPSVVVTSDAGAGIGYSGLRIRGTDMNRINITMNGIPLNDSESHGVWWVNMPDFASSVDNIQIQRGVGTSTNGAAAFGASINIQTLKLNPEPYTEISNSYGSFDTWKHSAAFGTGLLGNHWAFNGRLSKISTNGFIDRASSDLKSMYLSGGYYGKKDIVKFNILSGKEKTYQAWYGIPSEILDTNRTYNYYTYENQTDNYQQDHYQMFYSHKFNRNLNINTGIHYTNGEGYYESFKEGEDLEDYLLQPVILQDIIPGNTDTIFSTDLVNQKWLDNDFYGAVFSVNYENFKNFKLTFGGGWNKYEGDHFGNVIWARFMSNGNINHQYYYGNGHKQDGNVYAKANYQLMENINLYGDLQYRMINYKICGVDDDQRDIAQEHDFGFFNPKAGVFVDINKEMSAYGSFAMASREPNRSNYVDAPQDKLPTEETLYDFEFGYTYKSKYFRADLTGYYMDYKDQLVLTGEINDVGSAIMVNVPESYRMGVEVSAAVRLIDRITWEANATFSQNKIKNFTEYVDDWDTWSQISKDLGETDISFSPNVIANEIITIDIVENFKLSFISQYIGEQYIDNTSNKDRKLDAYLVQNVRFNYAIHPKGIKEISFSIMANNLLDEEYESNAWVYRYYLGGQEYKMDGFYPQAGTNVLGAVTLKF